MNSVTEFVNSVTGNETPKLRGFRSQPPNCGVALALVVSVRIELRG